MPKVTTESIVFPEKLVIKDNGISNPILKPERIYSPYNIVIIDEEYCLLKYIAPNGNGFVAKGVVIDSEDYKEIQQYYVDAKSVVNTLKYCDFNLINEDDKINAIDKMKYGYSQFKYNNFFDPLNIYPNSFKIHHIARCSLVSIEQRQNKLKEYLNQLIKEVEITGTDVNKYILTDDSIYPSRHLYKNPNNIVKFKGGKKLYYLKKIQLIAGTGEIIATIVKADTFSDYNNVLNNGFSDLFEFVPFTSLTYNDYKNNITLNTDETASFNRYSFAPKGHDFNGQARMIDGFVDNLRAVHNEKDKNQLRFKPSNFDFEVASTYDINKIDNALGVPKEMLSGENMCNKADKTIILNRNKKSKQKPIILEEEPILGFEDKWNDKFSPDMSKKSFTIGCDLATASVDYGQDIIIFKGEKGYDHFFPYNRIKYSDKICIPEEKCIVLPPKK